MQILLICKASPESFKGGIEIHVWKLSEWLLKQGHKVSILTGGSVRKKTHIKEEDGISIIRLQYLPGRYFPLLPKSLEEFSFNWSAYKWIKANHEQFDIVHIHGRSGILFPLFYQANDIKVVSTLHGLIDIENKNNRKAANRVDQLLHQELCIRVEKKQLAKSDAIIAVSRGMAEQAAIRGADIPTRAKIIPNGINPLALPEAPEKDPNLLVFVGRLFQVKGVFQLIEAMKLVPEHIRLVMIGEGDERKKMEKLIQRYKLQDRITLLGAIPNDEVLHWMQKAYALVLPSLQEPQGIVLLEANLCGIPVMASAVGGIKEVVSHGENGLLFPPNQPEKIVETINYLFQNPELAKNMGQRGKKLVESKYTWKQVALQTQNVYREILNTAYASKPAVSIDPA